MADHVEYCKSTAVDGMEMFLRNFAHVPDDRLTWTPTPTAKSAIRVAAHTALYAGRFAAMIRDQKLPAPENLQDWIKANEAEEIALTDRAEVERVFRQGTEEVVKALNGLSEADIALTLDSGQGWSVPMKHLMSLPGWHATLHTGQIDYLQTCWGDQTVYLG